MQKLLPEGVSDIVAVVENNCNQSFTFSIDGPRANFVGSGDRHESEYDNMKVFVDLNLITDPKVAETPGHCYYWMVRRENGFTLLLAITMYLTACSSHFYQNLYPSKNFEQSYDTSTPEIFAVVVACTFVLIAAAIVMYHVLVERRNTKLVKTTARSNKIVTGLFPSNVRDKLLEGDNHRNEDTGVGGGLAKFMSKHDQRGTNIDLDVPQSRRSGIIADHFKEATILFAGK